MVTIVSFSRSYSSPRENDLCKLQNHQITTKRSISRQLSSKFIKISKLAGSSLDLGNNLKRIFQSAKYSYRGVSYSDIYEDLKEAKAYCESINSTDRGRAEWNGLNSTLEDNAEVDDDVKFGDRRRQDAFQLSRPEQYPYSVLLVSKQDSERIGVCTGSLLTAEWVLTAAHCLMSEKDIDVTSIEIYAGGYSFKEFVDGKFVNGSQRSESTEFYPHPHYKDEDDFDVGLVKAKESFNLTNTVNTVRISTDPWSYQSYYNCVITGYGVVQLGETNPEDKTRKTHFLMVKQPCLCKFRFGLLLGTKKVSRYICTKPMEDHGICPGDSGGGLVCDGKIKGLAMQMIAVTRLRTCQLELFTNTKCGSKNTFSIFEDTCPFLRWVNSRG